MPLTPEDVIRKSFGTRLRGYDTTEVDAFLEEVVAELRRMEGQVDELRADVLTLKRAQSTTAQERLETDQLKQVRAERAQIVQELAVLQQRHDELQKSQPSASPRAADDPDESTDQA